MRTLIKIIPLTLLLICNPLSAAEKDNKADEVQPPPELTDEAGQEKHLPEPEVTIIKRKEMTVEEYRVNGRLRYAKIIPTKGPAYYMVDTDGDGLLDTRHGDLSNPPIQQWILYKW
ncbi:MAG: DUF2782 domain-containing protein [Gammaproteobacteria bacterium]|nr:DUF2782 domain-containing protein [Gammaproteobacteria bacterium]MDH5653154.1 DUF2782 domain-containing protein [Gammaproteobacteria bacterium]